MSEPVPLPSRISSSRPNWRLKAAREQRGWSQQELADRLNITPNSVSRWERGISSPGPYFRRQLCELLGKSFEELGLLPGKPALGSEHTAQPHQVTRSPTLPIWNVPFQRNPFFTGREQELMSLHKRLHSGRRHTAHPLQAICGLGGMGKTQMAVEYCYRFYEEYQAVLWVRAETHETLVADFAAIAALLDLPERIERDQQLVVEAVKRWLRAQRNWLLVLDNVENLTLIQEMLPPLHQGCILLTMRGQATGTLAQSLDLKKMDVREGALLLLRRSKYIPLEAELSEASPAEYALALELAQVLDGLPLALDQAGAYIEETACGFGEYLRRYRWQRAPLLQQRGSAASGHPTSLATTFFLQTERVEARNVLAANLLRLCAFLYPDAIPETMIVEGASATGPMLEPLARDPYAFDAAIKTLRDFSLIQRHTESKTLSLHRLVQVVIQEQLGEQERREWTERTVALVNSAFPDTSDDMVWPRSQQYTPQALACVALIEESALATPEAGALLLKVGTCLLERNRYTQAEQLLPRARDILLHSVGEMHIDYAECLNNMALLYHYWGRYEQAETLYWRALDIHEQIHGTEHRLYLTVLNNLGGLLYNQGRYAEAETLLRRVLELKVKQLGAEHLDVVHILNNIGGICMDQGKYVQAELFLLRAATLREQLLGPEHPRTLLSHTNLANLYVARKQYEQAESLHRRVLALCEKQLGPEHAYVGKSLHSLAHMYHAQGRFVQAEDLYRRALAIRERELGAEHPQTVETLNGLALLLLERGQDEQAEEMCQRALSIRERVLGPEHPDYAESLATLALLVEHQGDENRAAQLYRHVLSLCEGVLEPEHPLAVRCRAASDRLLGGEPEQQPSISVLAPSTFVGKDPSESEAQTSPPAGEYALLDDFLAGCCELNPLVWCRASDLWSAYQRLAEQQGERFPLSRRAFAEALRLRGCRADRTNEYRIWRGIALHVEDRKE